MFEFMETEEVGLGRLIPEPLDDDIHVGDYVTTATDGGSSKVVRLYSEPPADTDMVELESGGNYPLTDVELTGAVGAIRGPDHAIKKLRITAPGTITGLYIAISSNETFPAMRFPVPMYEMELDITNLNQLQVWGIVDPSQGLLLKWEVPSA